MSDTADPSDAAEADGTGDADETGDIVEGATSRDADDRSEGGDTVPEVELGLYQVSVRVQGRSDDDLATVEETATELIDHLVERASTLEEEPDQRGLG
ncbi:hypothetical protein Hbl1158_10380 [Halobaculum sp. CBA1158]|uniref:hypothetical protein n=1 Tax=Halobaculum sp. CBA1158 TaxID=2904243 RepID=UPI001F35323B|nr:hypothetical protein [Halobaculum sp. CBA1158]UIO98941.1 hypothetical protein Hbl1158_10380 [Halobaculum sp. CBA1158]